MLSLSFLLRFLFILFVKTPVSSDFAALYNAAQHVCKGDYSPLKSSYFQFWAYQTPFVLYEALILKSVNHLFVLKFLNVCYMVGINLLIYLISKQIVGNKVALVVSFLYAVYPASIFMSSVLTNQHIATFFFYLGIYFLMKTCNYKNCLLSGICVAVGNLMRPEGIIIILSFIIVWLLLLTNFSKAEKKNSAKNMAVIILSYFLVLASANWLIIATGVNTYGTSNQRPEWKFILGLDTKSNGVYSEEHSNILDLQDRNARQQETIKLIQSNFQTPKQIANFVYCKTQKMWASYEDGSWSFPNYKETRKTRAINMFDKSIYLYVNLLLTCYLIYEVRKIPDKTSTIRTIPFFLVTMILLNYGAYLFIEIQPRYRYFIMPAVFIAACGGLQALSHLLTQKMDKTGTKKVKAYST